MVELRKWKREDEKILAQLCAGINRDYLRSRLPSPYTIEDARWWLDMACALEGTQGIFRAIVVDGVYAGNITVEQKDDVSCKDAEIGYILQDAYRSRGIVTEAVRQICRLAFDQLDIIRLTATVFSPNMASRRVLEKNGFRLEGTMRRSIWKDGNIYDGLIYGLLREEWN